MMHIPAHKNTEHPPGQFQPEPDEFANSAIDQLAAILQMFADRDDEDEFPNEPHYLIDGSKWPEHQ